MLAPPLQSGDMYLQDEEGSGSEYVEDKSKYPHDDEEDNSPNEEGSGSGEGPLGKINIMWIKIENLCFHLRQKLLSYQTGLLNL